MTLMFSLCVGGRWIDEREGSIDVLNPADESLLGKLPIANRDDLMLAVASAEKGFAQWSRHSAKERSQILVRAAGLIRDRKEELAKDLTREQGKPLAEARSEAEDAADWFEWYAEEGKRAYGRLLPSIDSSKTVSVIKEPAGVVAVFAPWNFPISEPAAHMAAALAAGCSVIVKPAEDTPAAAARMIQACFDAGIPNDVINLVYGLPADISEFLIAADAVRVVAFTGSIPVGKRLAAMAASRMKRFVMELGGNAPTIVCGDVDPANVARLVAAKKFRNAGQVCTAPNRIFVNKCVYDNFVESLSQIASAVRVGDGLEEGTQMGPLVNAKRVSVMAAVVDDAIKRGAKVLAGGSRPNCKGFFWPPTVIAGLGPDALAMTDEIFGPVAAISPFDTIDEAISRANATNAGLASYIFTNSTKDAMLLSRGIKTGLVGINTTTVAFPEAPFGGVKDSGLGRVGGSEGIKTYFDTKTISMGLDDV